MICSRKVIFSDSRRDTSLSKFRIRSDCVELTLRNQLMVQDVAAIEDTSQSLGSGERNVFSLRQVSSNITLLSRVI